MKATAQNRIENASNALTRLALLAMMCLCAGLIATPALAHTADAEEYVSTEYQQDRPVVEVPFEYRNKQLFVHVEAAGRANLSFLLDTGSTDCVVDSNLQLPGSRRGQLMVRESTGIVTATNLCLDHIRLQGNDGSLDLRNGRALEMDMSHLSQALRRKVDGILGMSFVEGYVIDIDYRRGMLLFRNGDAEAPAPADQTGHRSIQLEMQRPGRGVSSTTLLVTGKLGNGEEYNFLLDTGFGGFLSIAEPAARRTGLLTDADVQNATPSYTLSGEFRSAAVRGTGVTLGEVSLSDQTVTVDLHGDMTDRPGQVGNGFLEQYLVRLDCGHRKLWLTPQ